MQGRIINVRFKHVISINPDLTPSHSPAIDLLYQMERSFADAAHRQGLEYSIIGDVDSQPPADLIPRVIKRLVHGSGYASDPTEWSKRFLGREGRELCDAVLSALDQVPGLEPERTTLFLYHGHPLHIPALIRLGLALSGRSPIVLNLYHLHQAYGLHRPKRVPGLRELLQYTRELRRAANVHLFVDSERLGKMIEADTNEKFEVLPFFSTTGDIASPATSNPGSTRPVCLAYPTWFPARDKGFDLVIALAERLRGRNLDILARRNEGQPSDVCLPTKASLAGGLSILPGFLSADRYKEFLSRSDVMLIPYSACEFLTRTSSAVADGVLFAKPMVGTAGTWIGDQIESLGGGVTFNDGDEADFARAVEKVVDGLEGYQKNLLTHRDHWLKKNSLSAFVRRMTSLQRTELSPRATSIWMARLFFFRYRYRLASLAAANTHRLFFISRWLGGKSGSLQLRYYGGLRNFRKLPAIVWRTRGVTEVELRLDAHDGFLLERGGSRGSIWTAVLIPEGAQIFLQDVSNGKPLLPQHTLDRLTFHVDAKAPRSRRPIFWRRWHVRKAQNFLQAAGRVSRSRTPDWIVRFVRTILSMGTGELAIRLAPIEPKNTGEATVSWSCEGVSSVEVLACGKVFARGGSVGSATTGKWVTDGMTFTLVDAESRRLLPAFRVMDIVTIGASPEKYPVTELGRARSKAATAYQSLSAVDFLRFLVGMRWLSRRPTAQLRVLTLPNEAEENATAIVEWHCDSDHSVEIRVDGLRGALLTKAIGPGTVETGPWVKAGTSFALVETPRKGQSRRLRVLDFVTVPSQRKSIQFVEPHEVLPGTVASRLSTRSPVLSNNKWYVIPPPSSGEVFLLASYAQTFLEQYGGDEVVVVTDKRLLDVLRLFPDAPVGGFDIRQFDEEELKRPRHSRVFRLEYRPYAAPIGRYAGIESGFAQLFFSEVRVSVTAPRTKPRVVPALREAARERMRYSGLIEGSTVFLSPTSLSQPAPPVAAWCSIANQLSERGFSLATNCGPNDTPIPRTIFWGGSLAELYASVELGGWLVSARSGICDLCSEANTRMHILQYDFSFLLCPGVKIGMSLAANGLTDRATYHLMRSDEQAEAFAKRVVSDPDFRSATQQPLNQSA